MRPGLAAASFPFVTELSEAARREFGAHAARHVSARRLLLQPGSVVEGAYFVSAGWLRVYYVTSGGREATLYRVESGETCVLALMSAFRQEPYPAWVESGDRGASFVVIPEPVFRRLFDGERPFRDHVFGALAARVFELMQTLEEAGAARVEERLARYLLKHAGDDGALSVTQAAIASELGTAREVVFRVLRSLARSRLIEVRRARVLIVDRARLHGVAKRRSQTRQRAQRKPMP